LNLKNPLDAGVGNRFSRNENVIEIDRFHFHVRAHLNETSRRATAVTGTPLEIKITNFPEDAAPEIKNLPNHPKDKSYGKRPIPFSRTIWLSREDWRDVDDDKDFYGLAPGKEIRLKYAYNIKCTDILERDAETGVVTKVAATYDPENKTKKCKVLTWLGNDESNTKPRSAEVRVYHHLFTCPVPGAAAAKAKKEKMLADKAAGVVAADEDEEEEKDVGPPAWLDDVNPNSMETTTHMFDASVFAFADKPFTRFQMERVGYYVVDPDSTMEKPVFNRTLGLRERADKKKVGGKTSGGGAAAAAAAGAGAGPSPWTKTEIKVGQIVKAWEHPDSEKVSFGCCGANLKKNGGGVVVVVVVVVVVCVRVCVCVLCFNILHHAYQYPCPPKIFLNEQTKHISALVRGD
jgi:hypothetical protein